MSPLRVNRNNFGNSYICGSGPPKEGRAEKIKSQKADRCDEKHRLFLHFMVCHEMCSKQNLLSTLAAQKQNLIFLNSHFS